MWCRHCITNLSLKTAFWNIKAGGSLWRYWKQGQQGGALWGEPGAAPRQTQGKGGAGNEGARLRLGKRQKEQSEIKEYGWLSLKKKRELIQGKRFIFVYHQPTLPLNINKLFYPNPVCLPCDSKCSIFILSQEIFFCFHFSCCSFEAGEWGSWQLTQAKPEHPGPSPGVHFLTKAEWWWKSCTFPASLSLQL